MALGDFALGAAAADAAVRPLSPTISAGAGSPARRVAVDLTALQQTFGERGAPAKAPGPGAPVAPIVAKPAQAAAPLTLLASDGAEPATSDVAAQALRAQAAYGAGASTTGVGAALDRPA